MKKKSVILVMMLMLLVSLTLTGCNLKGALEVLLDKEPTQQQTDEPLIETDDPVGVIKEDLNENVIPEPQVTEEPSDTEEPVTNEPSDSVSVRKMSAATLENPAKLGEWVEITAYSTETKAYHPVYLRILNIVRGSEAEKVAEKYNAGNNFFVYEIDEEDREVLEFAYIDYEVQIPKDFPMGEYGKMPVSVNFNIVGFDGLVLKSNGVAYIGLRTGDVTELRENVFAGDTRQSRGLFAILKDVDDFLFEGSAPSVEDNSKSIDFFIKSK